MGPRHPVIHEESAMTVAKIIEINSASKKSLDDAVQKGLTKCAQSVKSIKGAWINDIKVVTNDAGKILEWRVDMKVTFVVA